MPAKIEAYSFGSISVDGRDYEADLLVLPSGVRPDWWRREGHSLCLEDLAEVLAERPEVLVVGQGQPGLMSVPASLRRELEGRGIELRAGPTVEAVRTFNELSPQRRVAAALHLTC